ncbi:MAG: cytochrome c biogenesis protein CcsA [bacterium]|nr:cytochrome c biogenesis protein CcsA [Myxococcales bacterium]
MNTLFAIGVGAYAATTIAYLASLWTARPVAAQLAVWLLRATLLYQAALIGWWAFESGFTGGTRMWLSVSAFSLGAVYLMLQRHYPITALGSFVTALATVLAHFALIAAHPYHELVTGPVAAWILRVHIGLAFIGVTGFAFATAVSLVYLIQARMLKQKAHSTLRRRLPPLDVLDRLSLRSIIIGFPFYTIALLLGSAQAVRQDTFEIKLAYIFAAISWLIYGAVLQARLTAGWRGNRAAILTAVGLVATMLVVAQYSLGAV